MTSMISGGIYLGNRCQDLLKELTGIRGDLIRKLMLGSTEGTDWYQAVFIQETDDRIY